LNVVKSHLTNTFVGEKVVIFSDSAPRDAGSIIWVKNLTVIARAALSVD